jgi:hypothetical protein
VDLKVGLGKMAAGGSIRRKAKNEPGHVHTLPLLRGAASQLTVYAPLRKFSETTATINKEETDKEAVSIAGNPEYSRVDSSRRRKFSIEADAINSDHSQSQTFKRISPDSDYGEWPPYWSPPHHLHYHDTLDWN